MRSLLLAAALLLATAGGAAAQQQPSVPTQKGPALKQWVYIIRPVPRLREASAWTPADNQAAGAHFAYLQRLTAERQVILAGRTMQEPMDEKTAGFVIFEAATAEEARRLAEADPAVKAGVFTMELFPFSVALQRAP